MNNTIYIDGELFVKVEILKKYLTPDQLVEAGIDDHAEAFRSIQRRRSGLVRVRRKKRYSSSYVYVGKHRCR